MSKIYQVAWVFFFNIYWPSGPKHQSMDFKVPNKGLIDHIMQNPGGRRIDPGGGGTEEH